MAKEKRLNTVDTVWQICSPVVEQLDLQLWDVRFVKEGANWFLRLFIDKEEGITIEDCEKVSRAVDVLLEETDPIDKAYILEVSSPGIERELTRDFHFEKYIGADVLVKMIRPIEGIGKEFDGILKNADKLTVTIGDNGENEVVINKKDTVWIKLDDFNI